jgi:ABC-type transporter Mla subunit MlaD
MKFSDFICKDAIRTQLQGLNGKSINPRDDKFTVQLANAGQLKPASQVRVSGVPSGKVEDITLIEPGKVHVTITLTNKAVVPKIDAKAAITSVGLAGDAMLMLFPGESPTVLPKGQVIMGFSPPGLMEIAGGLPTAPTACSSTPRA